MKLQKEIVYKWSIWKRYSDFDILHNNLVQSLGWQMNGIDIAPSHTFVFNKLSAEFIDQRKEDLNIYWQKIIRIDKICEFNKHHCSNFIKEFIDVDNIIKNKDNIAVNAGKDNSTDNGIAESDEMLSNHTSNNKAAKRLSSNNKSLSRRSITTKVNNNNNNTNTNTSNNVVQSQSQTQSQPQPQPQAQSNDNTTKKDERFAPYAKMLQIGTPEMAVRLKMGMSGFSESEIDMFFSGGSSSSSGSSSSTKIKPPPPPSSSTAPPPPQPKQNNNNNNNTSNPPPTALPKPTGQRVNLLASISALRKD